MEGCSSLNVPTHETSYRPNADDFPGQLLTYKLALIPCLGLCPALVAATGSGRKEAGVRCQGCKSGCSSLVREVDALNSKWVKVNAALAKTVVAFNHVCPETKTPFSTFEIGQDLRSGRGSSSTGQGEPPVCWRTQGAFISPK